MLIIFIWFLLLGQQTELYSRCEQVVFANISVEGRLVHSDVYGLFDDPGHIVTLHCYDFEIFQCCFVTSNVLMFKYVLLGVPYISLQKFCLIPQYILHHISVPPHLNQYLMLLCFIIACRFLILFKYSIKH